METYCVKYRKNTENLNSESLKTKKGRLVMQSNVLNADLASQDL